MNGYRVNQKQSLELTIWHVDGVNFLLLLPFALSQVTTLATNDNAQLSKYQSMNPSIFNSLIP